MFFEFALPSLRGAGLRRLSQLSAHGEVADQTSFGADDVKSAIQSAPSLSSTEVLDGPR